MSRERCMCGDPDCPSCGAAMGTYTPPQYRDEDYYASRKCDVCAADLEEGEKTWCPECRKAVENANATWRK